MPCCQEPPARLLRSAGADGLDGEDVPVRISAPRRPHIPDSCDAALGLDLREVVLLEPRADRVGLRIARIVQVKTKFLVPDRDLEPRFLTVSASTIFPALFITRTSPPPCPRTMARALATASRFVFIRSALRLWPSWRTSQLPSPTSRT